MDSLFKVDLMCKWTKIAVSYNFEKSFHIQFVLDLL